MAMMVFATAAGGAIPSSAADGHGDPADPGGNGEPDPKGNQTDEHYWVKVDPEETSVPGDQPKEPCYAVSGRAWPIPNCVATSLHLRLNERTVVYAFAYSNSTNGTYGAMVGSEAVSTPELPQVIQPIEGSTSSHQQWITVGGQSGVKTDCKYCPPPPEHFPECPVGIDHECYGNPNQTQTTSRPIMLLP